MFQTCVHKQFLCTGLVSTEVLANPTLVSKRTTWKPCNRGYIDTKFFFFGFVANNPVSNSVSEAGFAFASLQIDSVSAADSFGEIDANFSKPEANAIES